ncbi:hypothetical protein [Novacetimonas pomaceti]|uniref:Uncharacterized protein n=1 Tax=Novacetimonas pomaceti TaxID=2021998 RepID=A0A318QCN2_9PROT|nr:hypothetical protein [Novacetimonas pomaceti]MBV1834779.1 hypothetical protein [Novacetimonas pomaceti]PYD49269.1 hypothetical protein C3920_00605 [Novacetimonas pomaceti]PYD75584.1 hypothetical protein CFR71_08365 [Novacetimonas pomaceti]
MGTFHLVPATGLPPGTQQTRHAGDSIATWFAAAFKRRGMMEIATLNSVAVPDSARTEIEATGRA